MKQRLGQLGGQLGVLLCVAGFLLVFLGWNGAASRNFVPAQFPYLISGGVAGLALVVVGVGVIVVQNQRTDRAALEATMERLIDAVERSAGARANGAAPPTAHAGVIAGRSSYHRPDCRLASGRSEADAISVEEATARGLSACRICTPPVAAAPDVPAAPVAPEAEEPEAGEPPVAEPEDSVRSRPLRAR